MDCNLRHCLNNIKFHLMYWQKFSIGHLRDCLSYSCFGTLPSWWNVSMTLTEIIAHGNFSVATKLFVVHFS